MVSALLDGRKTQTRRVLASLRGLGKITEFGPSDTNGYDWHCRDREMRFHDLRDADMRERLPYAVGDLLYVRECWRTMANWDDQSPSDLMASNALWPGHEVAPLPRRYDADGFETGVIREENYPFEMGRLRAAMHMPKRLSRITLKVTDVRVERVQEISEADAKAEGLEWYDDDDRPDRDSGYVLYPRKGPPGAIGVTSRDARLAFNYLWDSINSPRGFGWQENPWVVAISFSVIRANVDQLPGPQAKAENTQRACEPQQQEMQDNE